MLLDKIVSGGQTGVDRAALDAALSQGLAIGGWCPAGRRAEDGSIPDRYPLSETRSRDYAVRTRRNVRDADGTLVLNAGALDGGTLVTVAYAGQRRKPHLVVQLDEPCHARPEQVAAWLQANGIRILNVAGPRESKRPGIYRQSSEFLKLLLSDEIPARCSRG